MKKLSLVFPGQGSQKIGMGQELAETYVEARKIFELSDKILGFPLSKLCWDGPEDELRKTINTQPAILATSIACYKVLSIVGGIRPEIVAGHSVGEYSALVAADVLTYEDALCIVRRRGELMHEAGETAPGSMAAIIGMDYREIMGACTQANSKGIVEIANFNTPEQIVISGELEAVQTAIEIIKEKGARRVALLNVGAAFHSSLMKSAAEKLALELDRINFKDPVIPVVANISGRVLNDANSIRTALKEQIIGNVLWVDSIKTMMSLGVDCFVEVGTGKTLSGMIKKIDKNVSVFNIEDNESFEKARNGIKDELLIRK